MFFKVIPEIDESIECFQTISTDPIAYKVFQNKDYADDLSRNITYIAWLHLVCAIFLQIAYIIELISINSHSNIYFKGSTLPVYIYIILKCQ